MSRIWATARLGDTSDVHVVEQQWLNALTLYEPKRNILRLAGDTLRIANEPQNQVREFTKSHYIETIIAFMDISDVFKT